MCFYCGCCENGYAELPGSVPHSCWQTRLQAARTTIKAYIPLTIEPYLISIVDAVNIIPKSFLSGFGWQGMADIARTIVGEYSIGSRAQRACFAALTGLGGALGVFSGNMLSHALAWAFSKCLSEDDAKTFFKNAARESVLYALATFAADSIWQPLVTALGASSLASVWGVGMICGVVFLITLLLMRDFILTSLRYDNVAGQDAPSWKKPAYSDLKVSLWNVCLSASFFVFTSTPNIPSTALSSPFFIKSTMSTLESMWLAGQATLAGYGFSQLIEIFFKWILRAFGLMTDDDYIASMV